MERSRVKQKRSFNSHVGRAAQQAIAPDRIQIASHRELGWSRSCVPAGESQRYAAGWWMAKVNFKDVLFVSSEGGIT